MPSRDLPAEVTEYLDRIISDALQASEKARNAAPAVTQPLPASVLPTATDGLEEEPEEAFAETAVTEAAEETTAVDAGPAEATLPRWPETAADGLERPKAAKREQPYSNSLALAEKRLGPYHPELADLLANLALIHHRRGEYEEAEHLQRRALRIREKALGPEHPKVATSLNNLALLCRAQEKNTEARELWERSLEILEKTYGVGHPKTAVRVCSLADLSYAQQEWERAEEMYQRLLEIVERTPPPRQSEMLASLKNYPELLRKTGRAKQAREAENRIAVLFGARPPEAASRRIFTKRFWRW